MESEQMSRLGVALAISIGIHIFVAVIAEAGSGGQPVKKATQSPAVEITRVAMDGTTLPSGKGNSSFNSPASKPDFGFGQRYNLDAGVPTKIKVPAQPPLNQNTQTQNSPQSQPNNPTQPPVQPVREPQQPVQNPSEFYPPVDPRQTSDPGVNSQASRPSTAGNEGKKRSRGPNRVAFPEYTVEPQVPTSMMSGGVTNSVDVSVEIGADGAHTEKIVRSSGSAEVDNLVLEALKQWRWDPAAREGQAIASTQNFKFTFKPR